MTENTVSKTNGIATAALILGVMGALGFIFVFPPFVFGATAIALGLLSGTREGMSMRAKIAIIMGALSMIILIICIVSAVHFLMSNPDFVQEFEDMVLRMYEEMEENGVITGGYDFT